MLKILTIDASCTGCGACVSSCPKSALTLVGNEEGFYYPKLNETLCVDCKLCETKCHAISNINSDICDYIPYMGKSRSSDTVAKSSSGGAFSVLAESILEQGGVVFGARYNFETERLEQTSTDACSMDQLRKSKYIESYIGDSFNNVKVNLKQGRKVLFCGTPCHVKGLKTFLGNSVQLDNLLLVDFICHGVPSNKHFAEYKHYLEKKYGAKVTAIDFRPKTKGWRTNNLLLQFANGKFVDIEHCKSLYLSAFLNNILLRKSCYTCSSSQHRSDITIADFWGIQPYCPEKDDNKGMSLLIGNTAKGKAAIYDISPQMEIEQLPLLAVQYALNRNFALYQIDKRIHSSVQLKKYGYIRYMKKLYLSRIIYITLRLKAGELVKRILRINN